ncbi:AAA family ATPase [Treponema primitia]|uniref:AAA family ATPase n=1 Tax=Treponema primitia TaxID=88058 RepID=UPI00397ECF2C
MGKIENELLYLIKADLRVIQIISYESLRIQAMLVFAAKALQRSLFIWNRIEGIKKWDVSRMAFVEEDAEARNPDRAFSFFSDTDSLILLLEDFHPNLTEHEPENIKRIRNAAFNSSPGKTLVLSQPFRFLPRELEKEVHILDIPYPGFAEIKAIYDEVCRKYHIDSKNSPAKDLHDIINAALGLTVMEADKAFSLAFIENGNLTRDEIPLVIREKENVIKKSGYLEYYHPKENMEDIGGLDNLKDWLAKRGRAFDQGAAEFGLTYPRGILLLGIPGTGKSLTAKAIGNLWQFPLLRLDMGKIFGGFVGESEKNIRESLNIAEAIAPSILWIDEIEKGLSGISGSGGTDGGTSSRVLGTFLTWMQEKSKPVFVVATANNIAQLPPELLRKGRVDEIFFTDLPTAGEREHIMAIHLRKKNRNPAQFDIKLLAQKSRGFSGAELEEVVKEALFQAYDDKGRDVETGDILGAIEKTYPLSQTMREAIAQMRLWAKSRAVAASSEEPEKVDTEKGKEIPQLKQETYNNPFIV